MAKTQLQNHTLFGLIAAFTTLLVGCSAPMARMGPESLAHTTTQPWRGQDSSGIVYQSEHYRLYTTIAQPQRVERLMQVLEGAYGVYQQIAGPLPPSSAPMVGLLFATRQQWNQYTLQHTGAEGPIYVKIVHGGYTSGDRFVAYDLGERETAIVVAHEGWHQFLARHFKGRLAPFLEEGFACLFENFSWEHDLPRWDLSHNLVRRTALGYVVRNNLTWTLDELIRMHAGNVIDDEAGRIEAFYAQSWAFAAFMMEADGGRYRKALRRLFRDTAAGVTIDPTGSMTSRNTSWNARGVRPLLEYYLQMPFNQIEQAYWRYVQTLVR